MPTTTVKTDDSTEEKTRNNPKTLLSQKPKSPEVISSDPKEEKKKDPKAGITVPKVIEKAQIEKGKQSNVKKQNKDNILAIDEVEKACVENAGTQTETLLKCKMIPVTNRSDTCGPSSATALRRRPPLSAPVLNERPLVVATHLVPSLPIALFETFAEAIEAATTRPVVLLYESRSDRPVAKGITDIAILPASEDWEEGVLLPVSFCFKHHLNRENSAAVYVDVVVATDRTQHVEDMLDLRGHRCSLPDRQKQVGASALLFDHLYTRGESPSFFGDTLDANTQVAALQLVAGKQAEVGVLESPVIMCHKNTLPGMESLQILTSLGPLPPYRIMINKNLPDALVKKITTYLLNVDQDKEWVERFAPFGVTSFAKNYVELYHLGSTKCVVTSVPYY